MQNPLESYRRTQRELRRRFDAFTRAHCPTCPTPCCLRPARIVPADILLAEATGWRSSLPETPGDDSISRLAAETADALGSPPESAESATGEPCEYLGHAGCTFPGDLRPFGCATYVCRYMYASLSRDELTRIKRLIRELEQKRAVLVRNVT